MREPITYEKFYLAKGKMRLGHTWFHFKEWDFTIMLPPKCGSSSIKQFIWMNELEDKVDTIRHYEVRGKVYVVVRNPFDRFVSLWKNKCRDRNPLRKHVRCIYGMTPEQLMEYIKAGNKDVHWTPQTTLISQIADVAGVTVDLIPLENLNDWWAEQGYGELHVFNTSDGTVPMGEELYEDICRHYAEDFVLYANAL